jgi:Flp pilus assembly protein TadG
MMKIIANTGVAQSRIGDESGSMLVELSLVIPLLLLLLVAAVDFGRAWYTSLEISGAAEAGTLYGINNPADVSGMQSAALSEAPDISGLTTTASYGCECPDGSSAVDSCSSTPTCTDNYVNYIQVTAVATYTFMIPWPGLPASWTISKQSRMRVGGN